LEETRKHRIYSGAKFSIVGCWFSLKADSFVKCIYTQSVVNR
jgi:hypothetical protein